MKDTEKFDRAFEKLNEKLWYKAPRIFSKNKPRIKIKCKTRKQANLQGE